MLFNGQGAIRQSRESAVYTTGSRTVDGLLGGGLRTGKLTILYGRSNSGKSQFAMQAVLCASARGRRSLYIDTEGAFRPERIEEMALATKRADPALLERIIYLRCSSAAQQVEAVRRMSKRKETADCRLVVVDTLTRNFSLDLPGSANMPDRQGALNVHLSEMARDAFLNGRAYLLTNRVTFGREGSDVGIGGSTVAQLVHASLALERKEGDIIVTDDSSKLNCSVVIGPAGIGV